MRRGILIYYTIELKKKNIEALFFYPSVESKEALSTLDKGENLLFSRTIEAIDMLWSVSILVS